MNKTKKVFLAGTGAALAGFGIYKYMTTRQNALPAEIWTVDEIPDLAGKVIIVTGANSGIGYEAALEFARKGAQTILACRSMEKAQAALGQIQTEIPEAPVEIMQLDLANLESVRQFAAAFRAKYDRLDVLLNNAGIMMSPYGLTDDGFERQFGTNHLGHFALTGLLLDLLTQTPGARVVNVSSTAHRIGKMDFENLMYAEGQGYSAAGAYGRSKLANLLFTYELQRHFAEQHIDALAVAAHPGTSATNLGVYLEEHKVFQIIKPIFSQMEQSAAMGALPSIRAAVEPQVSGGQYFGPGGPMELQGYPVVVASTQASHNQADARQLWQVSEALTGIRYNWDND